MKFVKEVGKTEVRVYLTIAGLEAMVKAVKAIGGKDEDVVVFQPDADRGKPMLVWREK